MHNRCMVMDDQYYSCSMKIGELPLLYCISMSVYAMVKVTGTHLAHAVMLSMNLIIGAPHYVILCLYGLGLAQ